MQKNRKTKIILWVAQIAAAVIMLQTLYFKFTAAPESVEIFTKLGVEPWGRLFTGFAELIAGVLLLTGRFSLIGAILTLIIMIGAILAHIFVLGIDSIFLALIVLVLALIVIYMRRKELKNKLI